MVVGRAHESFLITSADQVPASSSSLMDTHAPRNRWYVLGVLTIVYALNIADRFSISTLIEPIRLEMRLSDSGVAFLTGVALAVFYVTVGILSPCLPTA